MFLSVYRQVLPRDDRVIFALTDNKLRATHLSANNTQPIATINSFAGVPTAGYTSDDLAACHLLFNVLYAATAAFSAADFSQIKQEMPISKLFTASCTHSIAIYKVLCYNNHALGA